MMFSSFADIEAFAQTLPQPDTQAEQQATAHQNQLTKPQGSLGRLEELAIFLAGWQGSATPSVTTAQALVFAGNHGVCAQGINPFPQDVTAQMVMNFTSGGAAINQLSELAGASLSVHALDLETPTADFTTGPAMDEASCLEAMNKGAEAVDPEADIILLGEMGIGNSTVSAALCAASFGGEAEHWVGRGTGADDEMKARKAEVIRTACNRALPASPLQILAELGGREQAAICGAVLAARSRRQTVMLDGYISTSAVAPLHLLSPDMLSHCLVAHQSREPGHQRLLSHLNKSPLLDLNMCLGEGSGAAIALMIVRSALACHNQMASFASAGVSNKDD